MTEQTAMDILGWTGAVLYLAAYGAISFKKVEGDSWAYQGANIAAGVLLVVNNVYLRAYPSAGLNFVWVGIAALTLIRKGWKRKIG